MVLIYKEGVYINYFILIILFTINGIIVLEFIKKIFHNGKAFNLLGFIRRRICIDMSM